jgi:hypothetical protein
MVGANCLRVFGLRSASWPMALMDDPRAGFRLRACLGMDPANM